MSSDLIGAAKLPYIGYSEKNWDKVRAAVSPDFQYDEVVTGRNVSGIDAVLEIWDGWAAAFPHSEAEFHSAVASGNTVVLELTWNVTHTGPMPTPNGEVIGTGKTASVRAISVLEMENGKAVSCRQYFDMGTLLSQLGLN